MPYQRPEPLTKRHVTTGFDCGRVELNEWLDRYALPSQAARSARVFVTTETNALHVVGYYALVVASVEPSTATVRVAKGQPASRPIPVGLLARLAVDLSHQGKGLGKSLLKDATVRTYQAAEHVGIRAMLVHAKDLEAREFYLAHGFEPSPTDPLHVMMLMKDIAATIETGGEELHKDS